MTWYRQSVKEICRVVRAIFNNHGLHQPCACTSPFIVVRKEKSICDHSSPPKTIGRDFLLLRRPKETKKRVTLSHSLHIGSIERQLLPPARQWISFSLLPSPYKYVWGSLSLRLQLEKAVSTFWLLLRESVCLDLDSVTTIKILNGCRLSNHHATKDDNCFSIRFCLSLDMKKK